MQHRDVPKPSQTSNAIFQSYHLYREIPFRRHLAVCGHSGARWHTKAVVNPAPRAADRGPTKQQPEGGWDPTAAENIFGFTMFHVCSL